MVLELIKPGTHFNFLKYRKLAYLISAVVIVAGLVSLVVKGGPRYGVDFAGGLSIQIRFAKDMDVPALTKAMEEAGLENVVVQRFGQEGNHEYLARASEHKGAQESLRAAVDKVLATQFPDSGFSVQRLEMVGPKVGADLRGKALEAIFYSVLLIAIYIPAGSSNAGWRPASWRQDSPAASTCSSSWAPPLPGSSWPPCASPWPCALS